MYCFDMAYMIIYARYYTVFLAMFSILLETMKWIWTDLRFPFQGADT